MSSSEAGPSRNSEKKQPKAKKGNVVHKSSSKSSKAVKRLTEKEELEQLEKDILAFDPTAPLNSFDALPLSVPTKKGLSKAFFKSPTAVQKLAIPPCLQGKDILANARTGSGKTLAFLIPMLEDLYRKKWGHSDGLGALVIAPTRELAIQTFDVLRSIGLYHSFSAGLIIGGKDLKSEADRLSKMNILIATPGRLLQHLDQTLGFSCESLQTLILDEADRILDLGFQKTLTAIIAHLPPAGGRQTMLFSATQTKSIETLARLSLNEAKTVTIGISTDEEKSQADYQATPKGLEQHFAVVELDKKLDVLYSFIKSHLSIKGLVFVSSCKQVRFIYETFCKLQPGIPLLELHGKQKQSKRLTVFQKFTSSSQALLICTDIAARGLDFPAVDWVIQLDCPEDVDTYIHRVGRTARYERKGQALMLLCPSEEEGMIKALEERKVTVGKIKIRESKTMSVQPQMQSYAFQDPEIKYLGQKAFISYLKSIYVQKHKQIFDISALPVEKFASSLGLPGAPQIKFISQEQAKKKKNRITAMGLPTKESKEKDDEVVVEVDDTNGKVRTKYDKMFERKNQGILSEHYQSLIDHSGEGGGSGVLDTDQGDNSDSEEEETQIEAPSVVSINKSSKSIRPVADEDDGDDFITLKRADHGLEGLDLGEMSSELSKRKLKMGTSKKAMLATKGVGNKLIFDDEGGAHELYELQEEEDFAKREGGSTGEARRQFLEKEKKEMEVATIGDREVAKQKKREKKRKMKEREREENGMGYDDDEDDDMDDYEGLPDIDITGLLPSEDDSNEEDDVNDEEDDEEPQPAKKKQRKTLEEDEALALTLLEG